MCGLSSNGFSTGPCITLQTSSVVSCVMIVVITIVVVVVVVDDDVDWFLLVYTSMVQAFTKTKVFMTTLVLFDPLQE